MLAQEHERHPVTSIKGQKVLIAPLDWGLGHASRCIELIQILKRQNNVIIGITPSTAPLLCNVFPELKTVDIPALSFFIKPKYKFGLSALLQLPKFIKTRYSELIWTQQYKAQNPDLSCIISDNRYGMRHPKVLSICVTHQVYMQGIGFIRSINWVHKIWCKPFNQVWIPDYNQPHQALAGLLSRAQNFHQHQFYIGPLSQLYHDDFTSTEKYDIVILLSGPEPLRSNWANSVIKKIQTLNANLSIALISPVSLSFNNSQSATLLQCFVLPHAKRIAQLILNSNCVIARSGYSTLMDLDRLNKPRALLIPTPQQAEQKYLAQYWKTQGWAQYITESKWSSISNTELRKLLFLK